MPWSVRRHARVARGATSTRANAGYIDRSGADLLISQLGVTPMHMSASVLRPDIANRAREIPGVAWAEPIRYTTGTVSSPAGRSVTYVIGYDPASRHGGPDRLVDGRPPGPGEAVIDRQAADQLAVAVGDQVRILGRPFRLVGLSTGGTNIANTTVFIPTNDFARLRGPTQSYVLVGARPDADLGVLRARLEGIPPGNSVLTRTEFADSERRLVTDMSADVMRIMSGIGFGIALAVIALTLFNVTAAKTREYGVVKGARRPPRSAGRHRRRAGRLVGRARPGCRDRPGGAPGRRDRPPQPGPGGLDRPRQRRPHGVGRAAARGWSARSFSSGVLRADPAALFRRPT
jgi:hypothetical protein